MKVIKHGQYAAWGNPPAGVQKQCSCGATVETTEDEPTAVPTLQGNGHHKTEEGWNIPCPECHRSVFIKRPNAKADSITVKVDNVPAKAAA